MTVHTWKAIAIVLSIASSTASAEDGPWWVGQFSTDGNWTSRRILGQNLRSENKENRNQAIAQLKQLAATIRSHRMVIDRILQHDSLMKMKTKREGHFDQLGKTPPTTFARQEFVWMLQCAFPEQFLDTAFSQVGRPMPVDTSRDDLPADPILQMLFALKSPADSILRSVTEQTSVDRLKVIGAILYRLDGSWEITLYRIHNMRNQAKNAVLKKQYSSLLALVQSRDLWPGPSLSKESIKSQWLEIDLTLAHRKRIAETDVSRPSPVPARARPAPVNRQMWWKGFTDRKGQKTADWFIASLTSKQNKKRLIALQRLGELLKLLITGIGAFEYVMKISPVGSKAADTLERRRLAAQAISPALLRRIESRIGEVLPLASQHGSEPWSVCPLGEWISKSRLSGERVLELIESELPKEQLRLLARLMVSLDGDTSVASYRTNLAIGAKGVSAERKKALISFKKLLDQLHHE